MQSYGLPQAAWIAPRIVVGTVLEKGRFRFPGSRQYQAQPEGAALSFVRIRARRALKGPDAPAGEELRVFSLMEWFQHTHAAVIRHGAISYTDAHYSEAVPPDRIEPGMDVLVYFGIDPPPLEFPPGAVFDAFGGAWDRAERAGEILALLQEGPREDFCQEIHLQQGRRVRFSDGLEVVLLSHSERRSEEGDLKRQWIDIGLSKDAYRGLIPLAHEIDRDRKETWETRRWHDHTVELKAIRDGEPVIVVRNV